MKNVFLPLFTLGAAFVVANHANAAVIWSTIDGTVGTPSTIDNGNTIAQSFIVPSGVPGVSDAWSINSVGMVFESNVGNAGGVAGTFVVNIWSSIGGVPNILGQSAAATTLASNSEIANPSGGRATIIFNFGGLLLSAGDYWVVASATTGAFSDQYTWTTSSTGNPPGAPAITAGSGSTYVAVSLDGGVNWIKGAENNFPNQMEIYAAVVPEPATIGLIGGLGLLGFAGWRRYARK
jgi:hypothetical protein